MAPGHDTNARFGRAKLEACGVLAVGGLRALYYRHGQADSSPYRVADHGGLRSEYGTAERSAGP